MKPSARNDQHPQLAPKPQQHPVPTLVAGCGVEAVAAKHHHLQGLERQPEPPTGKIHGVTGVILAGGQSSRMGSNKALLPYQGGRFIESIHRQLRGLFDEVLLVTNTPAEYGFLHCPKYPDVYLGAGALAGLHSGLYNSPYQHIFAVACDMPYLNEALIRRLAARRHDSDVVIAEGEKGLEPLHAFYSRSCLGSMERALEAGRRRIVSFFAELDVNIVPRTEIAKLDPELDSFRNINTPDDYYRLRDGEREARREEAALGNLLEPAPLRLPLP